MNNYDDNWVDKIHKRDKVTIVDDVYTRNKKRNEEFHNKVKRTIKNLENKIRGGIDMGMPSLIIESYVERLEEEKQKLNMSVLEYEEMERKKKEIEELKRKRYIEKNPPKEENAIKIFKYFDLWFKAFKYDYDILKYEYETGHPFCDPFFFGGNDEKSEFYSPFYERILTSEDYHYDSYRPVFYVCHQRILERLNEFNEMSKFLHESI